MVRAAAIAIGLVLVGCAGTGRLHQYPAHTKKNITEQVVDGRRFLIKRHPTESSILIQPTSGRAALTGLTRGIVNTNSSPAQFKAAADGYAAAHGCEVIEVHSLAAVSYEATLKCGA